MKELELVRNVKKQALTDSLMVAEYFDKRHDNVLRDIKENILNLTTHFRGANFIETTYKSRGKEYPKYLMTKDGFTMLVMSYTGKKAMEFKERYIAQFNEMENFILSGELSKTEFRDLTSVIKEVEDNPDSWTYAREIDMINKIVLGVTSKDFKKKHGLGKNEPIRDHMTLIQIKDIVRLQRDDEVLLKYEKDFNSREAKLKYAHYNTVKKRNLNLIEE